MLNATTYAWLVLAFPLVGTILCAITWRTLPARAAGLIGTSAIALAFAATVCALIKLQARVPEGRQLTSTLWDYASTVGIDAQLTILVDPLSIYMMLVVTGVSTLIHLYSIAYMQSDQGYHRFFSYLNFFVFSMLLLVLAGNFLLLIVGWAFVGAASYLLISFWYRRKTATQAGMKAFVINVIGDVGLVLGTFFIFRGTGTLDFLGSFAKIDHVFTVNQGSLVAGCVLLLVGAFAKSAQVPFHTWLPDAMEGPTPVSALIHAATMVTAGVYLIARLHPLFEQAPAAAIVGAVIGAVTLLMAATIALTQVDLKRVIAYSTMSQIGYMIMGVSAGAYAAGLFHLMTHAMFKALLFMAAGSIISAMANVQSLDRMSGFRRALPFTFFCFIVGGLALAGVPPFSGFFSKDEILLLVGDRGGAWWILYGVGYVGAFLTAVYTFRMIFRAFLGEPCAEAKEFMALRTASARLDLGLPRTQGGVSSEPTVPDRGHRHTQSPVSGEDVEVGFPGAEHHVAERALPMKLAMAMLAVGATVAGALQLPFVTHVIDHFLEPTFADSSLFVREPSDSLTAIGLVIGAVLGISGIGLAYFVWVARPGIALTLQKRLAGVHKFLLHKWYWDELFDALIVRPICWIGRFAQHTFERVVVNGILIGGTTGIVRASSATVRALQSGFVRYYVATVLLGTIAVTFYFLVVSR